MYASLSVDGDYVDSELEDSFHVSVEWPQDGADYRCADCGADLQEDGTDENDKPVYSTMEDDETECPESISHYEHDDETYPDCGPHCPFAGIVDAYSVSEEDHYTVEVHGPHTPQPVPLSWINSAGIQASAHDNSVSVSLSVGDPRGAFVFTVRKRDDGTMILHAPYPGEGCSHMPLQEIHPGTFEVMPYGWRAPEPEPTPEPEADDDLTAACPFVPGDLVRELKTGKRGRVVWALGGTVSVSGLGGPYSTVWGDVEDFALVRRPVREFIARQLFRLGNWFES